MSGWEVLDITFLLVFQAKNVFFISSKIFAIFRIISINLTVWIDSKSNVNKIGPFVATKAFFLRSFGKNHVRQQNIGSLLVQPLLLQKHLVRRRLLNVIHRVHKSRGIVDTAVQVRMNIRNNINKNIIMSHKNHILCDIKLEHILCHKEQKSSLKCYVFYIIKTIY